MNNYSRNYRYDIEQTSSFNIVFASLMRKVYLWMFTGLLMTALTAMTAAKNSEFMSALLSNNLYFYGIIIGEFALVIYLSRSIMNMSFLTAGLCFALYAILNGLVMSVLFAIYTQESIATTFFATSATFGVMSIIGFVIKKDLSAVGRFLTMLLIGAIVATLVNFFIASSGLSIILNYVIIFIFVGLTAYHTQKIKETLIAVSQYGDSDSTQKIALQGSLALYLDFINLFLHLLRILGDRK